MEIAIPAGLVGAVFLLTGLIVMLTGMTDRRRRKRIIETPTKRIAEIDGGPVEIKGKIVASEKGTLAAPLSHHQVVWVRVSVQEERRSNRNTYWATIITESRGVPFLVEDGSGKAMVDPRGAFVSMDAKTVGYSGTFNDATPELEQFLNAHGKRSTGFLGFNRTLRYQEEVLRPGDSLYALGPSFLEGELVDGTGYRSAPKRSAVLRAAGSGSGELILTNKTEEQLTSRLNRTWMMGSIFAMIGAVACAVSAGFYYEAKRNEVPVTRSWRDAPQ